MNLRSIFFLIFVFALSACSGNRQQGVQAPPPQKKEPVEETDGFDPAVEQEEDPFKELNEEEDTDDLVDPTSVDVPTTDITSGGTGSSGLTTMISLIPMVTGLLNGQMPDINSILGLMGGGGGALSGVTSAIGGGNLSGLTSILGGP